MKCNDHINMRPTFCGPNDTQHWMSLNLSRFYLFGSIGTFYRYNRRLSAASFVQTGFGGDSYNVSRAVPETAAVLGVEASSLDPAPQCEAAIAVTMAPAPGGADGYTAKLDFYLRNW